MKVGINVYAETGYLSNNTFENIYDEEVHGSFQAPIMQVIATARTTPATGGGRRAALGNGQAVLARLPGVSSGKPARSMGGYTLGRRAPAGSSFKDPLTALGFADPLTAALFKDPLTAILFKDPRTAKEARARLRTYSRTSNGVVYYVHSLSGRAVAIEAHGATSGINVRDVLNRMRAKLGKPARQRGGGLVYEDSNTMLVVAIDSKAGFVLRMWDKGKH